MLEGANATSLQHGHPAGRRRRFPHANPVYLEFPQKGVTGPATGGGRAFSWGEEPVRSPPGIYSLCWCNSAAAGGCSDKGPFLVSAGSLRVATFREYAYLKRPPDPPPRALDQWDAAALSLPLALVFYLIIAPQAPFIGKRVKRLGFDDGEVRWARARHSPAQVAQARQKHAKEVAQVQTVRQRAESQGLRAAGLDDKAPDVPDFNALRGMARPAQGAMRMMSFLSPTVASISDLQDWDPEDDATSLGGNALASTLGSALSEPRQRAAPDPRGALMPLDDRPPPPAPAQADFGEYRRHAEVHRALVNSGSRSSRARSPKRVRTSS